MTRLWLAVVFGMFLSGCAVSSPPISPTVPPLTATSTAAAQFLTLTPAATSTAVLLETSAPEMSGVCSPLSGFALSDLSGMIVNPYHPPKPGSDDPHQGVDLAVLDETKQYAVSGTSIQAVTAGRIAGVTRDRFPYGNMIIIESALDENNSLFPRSLNLPTPFPKRLPAGALTCPILTAEPAGIGSPRSIYVLYGHMLNPPELQVGDTVACGQPIGEVGQSGNALNPHLHLENRVGPAGQIFSSMAHYDASANGDEIAAYCLWRVSGVYQTIDPGCLWGACPTP